MDDGGRWLQEAALGPHGFLANLEFWIACCKAIPPAEQRLVLLKMGKLLYQEAEIGELSKAYHTHALQDSMARCMQLICGGAFAPDSTVLLCKEADRAGQELKTYEAHGANLGARTFFAKMLLTKVLDVGGQVLGKPMSEAVEAIRDQYEKIIEKRKSALFQKKTHEATCGRLEELGSVLGASTRDGLPCLAGWRA